MITLNKVTKTFLNKKQPFEAVKETNLTINKGEIYGIVGYSGAGKSTLLRMLNGLERPSSGSVIIDDKELSPLGKRELRKERQSIGMIFQHFNLLWSRTVLENICFPLEIAGVPKTERIDRARELISLVGLSDKEKAYPAQLSGGEKQRVGIARALANDPKVLLCDEATSALDPQTTDEVLDLLAKINEELNVTIVLITHEMEVVRKICDRVAVMNKGNIVEEGSVLQVFRNPQEDITKRFIRQDRETDNKETRQALTELKKAYPDGQIIQLFFQGDNVGSPVITQVSRQCGCDINIIQGTIQSTHNTPVGTLIIQVLGDQSKQEQALELFKTYPVQVEVIE
ncbi:methionine ABC transporter ATP-binding protein [Alkalibacterium pelagium]|uniref:D-methionine transport system ATP-binding protein n=1 Tax=Alkalibacterium pelagium TaxID=426702 RepID=A0A1H7LVK5_9LACT|nr:methionine ABC transporter ATP-binding protein [Alkalibacterium pelagium]GEN50981.1 methionine import ATP-binding protein MetN 2 [Alkalibacterium pelagium]SEL02996.1 D-methionine transport system ATP-binding protein [Alkalibacterium pelagium]